MEPIFLTTHSSVALDIFGKSEHAQIIRVEHDGRRAVAKNVSTHMDRYSVVCELGMKPSDLLQSNGIVWVEGPSDRVYLNHWIHLFSDGDLVEGRDYQCAFYGGSLLGRSEFIDPDETSIDEFANLLWLNPRFILVADSDRTSKSGEGSGLKKRLIRVRGEVEKMKDGCIWIMTAKEIENYLPGVVLSELFGIVGLRDPGQFEYFFPTDRSQGKSYLVKQAKRKSASKMDLAIAACAHMTKANLNNRFDLKDSVERIVRKIREWNA